MISDFKKKPVVFEWQAVQKSWLPSPCDLNCVYSKYAGVCSEEESAPKEERLKEGGRKLKHKIGQAIKNIIKKSSEAVYHD